MGKTLIRNRTTRILFSSFKGKLAISSRLLATIEPGAFRHPKVAIVYFLPLLKPRSAAGEMNGVRGAGRWLLVPAFEPIPLHRQRTNVAVSNPLHAMQIGPSFAIDDFRRQCSNRWMLAIE